MERVTVLLVLLVPGILCDCDYYQNGGNDFNSACKKQKILFVDIIKILVRII